LPEEQTLAEIEDFIEGFNQPTFRGMRINGQGRHLVLPARVVRGRQARCGVAPISDLLMVRTEPYRPTISRWSRLK
jgi:hypothetical protein